MIKLLWIILLAWVASCKTEEEVVLGNQTEHHTDADRQAQYFRVTIPPEIAPANYFMVFDVSYPPDEFYDPDIFISSASAYPTIQNNDWKCTSYGEDVCVVPKESVAPNKIFHATVYCQKKCSYKLKVGLVKELELSGGDRVTDSLNPLESRIYRFTVPSNTNIRSISVVMDVDSVNSSDVRMFVAMAKNETDVPSTDNSVRVIPTWLGLAAKIYDDDAAWFCIGCTYKVLIYAKTSVEYTLSYTTSEQYTKLKRDQGDIRDVVRARERNCYQYKVKDSDGDLEIYLLPYSGDPNIYANPDSLPLDMNEFAYKTEGKREESLIITAEERRKHNEHGHSQKYYVCVFGETTSAYDLMINVQESEGDRRYSLGCGFTQTMSIKEHGFILFEYGLYTEEAQNLTFTLLSITGDADLFVKYCSVEIDEYGMQLGECDLKREDMYRRNVLRSTNSSSVDIINVVGDPKACSQGYMCSYLVGVYGVSDSSFSLSASCADKTQIPLGQGTPYYGWAEMDRSTYFVFTVDSPQTETVKIQLTSMNGDADLSVSRSQPYCDASHAEYASSLDSYLPDTVVYSRDRDGPLNSTYYATVYGSTYAMYSIVYSVTYKSGKAPASAIAVYDGSPQVGTLNGTEETALYKFSVDFTKKPTDIKIFLSPIHGIFNVYVGADYVPTEKNYTWTLSVLENIIYIRTTDAGYRPSGQYYVLVTKYNKADNSIHVFSIKYLTGTYMVVLMEGYPEMGNLTLGSSEFYKYYVQTFSGTLAVTVTPLLGDPDLYISVNSSNKFPTLDQHDYFSLGVGADSIQIDLSRMKEKNAECSENTHTSSDCAIYIAVRCSSDLCMYSLQASQAQQSAIRLIDGMPQFGTVSEGKPQFYVMIPSAITENADAVISVQPIVGRVKGYALLVPADSSLRPTTKQTPSPSKFDISSIERAGSQVLVISHALLEACGALCQYHIGVYVDNSGIVFDPNARSEYTITASSEFTKLADGATIIDFIPLQTYKYYRFYVSCRECTLSISLTPLSDGDPDLYINKDSYKLPDSQSSDFRSTMYRGDFLQITPSDPFFSSGQSISGTYTIAVYGAMNCTYSLTVATSESSLAELRAGISLLQEQGTHQTRYFKFKSWKRQDIKVSLTIHAGRATIRANAVSNSKEAGVLEALPSSERKSTWSSLRSNTNGYLEIKSSHDAFIANGTYIIAVETLDQTSYDILVDYKGKGSYTLLKVGEALSVGSALEPETLYAFIISNHEDITISLGVSNGQVQAYVSLTTADSQRLQIPQNGKVTIKTSDPIFSMGMYYITVQSSADSSYSLLVEQGVHPIYLSEGTPFIGTASSGTPLHFLFSVRKDATVSSTRRMSVYVKFYDPVADSSVFIKEVSRNDQVMPNPENSQYVIRYDSELNYLGNSVVLNQDSGEELALTLVVRFLRDARPVKFEIAAWTTGILEMVPGMVYMNTFSKVDEIQVYQLPVRQASTIYVEATPCLGEIEFYVTQSLTAIADRRYDIQKKELSKGRLFGSFSASKGVYYISVRAVADSCLDTCPTKGIWYTINAIASDSGSVEELYDYTMDNYGNIQYQQDGPSITLTWGNVRRRDQGRSQVTGVTYGIFVSEEGKANMQTACGMKFTGAEQLASGWAETSYTTELRKDQRGKNLIFNVVAHLPEYGRILTYNPLFFQVNAPRHGGSRGHFIFWMMIVVIVVLGGLAVYYCRKYKRVEAVNQYELSDVRRMGPPVQKAPYSSLMSQNQEALQ